MEKHIYHLRYKFDKTEWRARARRKLVVYLWNKYRIKTQKSYRALDFGCGTGILQNEIEKNSPNVTAFGVDKSLDAIKYCKKRGLARVKTCSHNLIPFPENKFDLLTSIDVLEHIEDDKQSLNEINRVLKKGGIAIIIVPAYRKLWSTRDIRLRHYRRYENGDLEDKLNKSGFKLILSKNIDFLFYFILLLMCKLAKRKNKVPDLKMDAAQVNLFLNEPLCWYEVLENRLSQLVNFPVGISKLIIAKKL